MRALHRWVCILGVAACAQPTTAVNVPPPANAKADAGVVPRSRPRAVVRQGLFWPDSDATYPATIQLSPTPAELVEPCYEKVLEQEPAFAGWMWISLQPGSEQPAQVTLRDHSEDTQQKLWPCVIGALSRVRAPMTPGPSKVDVYLSFAPE